MKQFTTTNLISSPSISMLALDPIDSAYINGLPPRGKYIHGSTVEFFFQNGELAVSGDIVQVGLKEEEFYLTFARTLGLEYWRNEMLQRKGEPVIRVTNLATEWRTQGLEALLVGPREVRFYTKNGAEITTNRLAAIEIIAKHAPQQRVLLLASEEDPGDVIVVTPSDGYDEMISELVPLEQRDPE